MYILAKYVLYRNRPRRLTNTENMLVWLANSYLHIVIYEYDYMI